MVLSKHLPGLQTVEVQQIDFVHLKQKACA